MTKTALAFGGEFKVVGGTVSPCLSASPPPAPLRPPHPAPAAPAPSAHPKELRRPKTVGISVVPGTSPFGRRVAGKPRRSCRRAHGGIIPFYAHAKALRHRLPCRVREHRRLHRHHWGASGPCALLPCHDSTVRATLRALPARDVRTRDGDGRRALAPRIPLHLPAVVPGCSRGPCRSGRCRCATRRQRAHRQHGRRAWPTRAAHPAQTHCCRVDRVGGGSCERTLLRHASRAGDGRPRRRELAPRRRARRPHALGRELESEPYINARRIPRSVPAPARDERTRDRRGRRSPHRDTAERACRHGRRSCRRGLALATWRPPHHSVTSSIADRDREPTRERDALGSARIEVHELAVHARPR